VCYHIAASCQNEDLFAGWRFDLDSAPITRNHGFTGGNYFAFLDVDTTVVGVCRHLYGAEFSALQKAFEFGGQFNRLIRRKVIGGLEVCLCNLNVQQ
jgi:hypothetical protein